MKAIPDALARTWVHQVGLVVPTVAALYVLVDGLSYIPRPSWNWALETEDIVVKLFYIVARAEQTLIEQGADNYTRRFLKSSYAILIFAIALNYIVQLCCLKFQIFEENRIKSQIKIQEAYTGMEIRPFLILMIIGMHIVLFWWLFFAAFAPTATVNFSRIGPLYFYGDFLVALALQYFAGHFLLLFMSLDRQRLM
jgi:hypothetical protein